MAANEFAQRTGHRFNLIIKSLPTSESGAIGFAALYEKLKKLGYVESQDQLSTDMKALATRGEIMSAGVGGDAKYWASEKGRFEVRKRTALIKLHNMDLTEEDVKLLEEIAQKRRSHLE
jgi:hypothetical protein